MTDWKTEILSEARFMDELRRTIRRATLGGPAGCLAHLGFAEMHRIRQSLGAGAEVEIAGQVAAAFPQLSRPLELVGRDSHGHFLILLPQTTAEQARARLEALGCEIASRTFQTRGRSIRLTATIGFLAFGTGASAEQIRLHAERALEYAALQQDLTPTEYHPSLEPNAAGAPPIRPGKWETIRGSLLIPFQLAAVVLLSWILPFFAYRGLDAAGLDISYFVYIAVVIALAATAFFIWLEG